MEGIEPIPRELSPVQRIHWERVLVAAELQREYALRMLGRLPLELGFEDEQQQV